ncbi:DUF4198 domain-containing protein [Olivibacter sp. SDN3]|uniref:DUF4198 domain-containing protein n=1 Tax=Olivibacter sp. SDN3 TaxID=2764720 RepID=UPI0016513B87|nr:DUF4198 domain-containing protein [Olivibacter sp. SDN3]QNL49336.1 DUF4198 domain-containing protein [Olivibacter sp. SDN3]
MKTIKITILALLCLTIYTQVHAHALWIETAAYGKKGTTQEVKIFYGEFATDERDVPDKWYSDVNAFTLWLVSPTGEKTKLSTAEGESFYTANFTPEDDGVYTLLVSHEAAELGGTTKYHFISSAYVSVGKATKINTEQNVNPLKIYGDDNKIYGKNKSVKLFAQLNGKPLANKAVSVASPEGWVKEVTTEADGSFEFAPLWPGRYVVEAQNYEKASGTHNGKAYDASWIGSTFSFEVK